MIDTTNEQVKAIGIFNSKLKSIESSIKLRGLDESQRAINKMLTQEYGINGYELDVEISMHSKSKVHISLYSSTRFTPSLPLF